MVGSLDRTEPDLSLRGQLCWNWFSIDQSPRVAKAQPCALGGNIFGVCDDELYLASEPRCLNFFRSLSSWSLEDQIIETIADANQFPTLCS